MDKHEKIRKIVKNLNVIDDTLFQKMAEDIGFCEELISKILKQKVTIKKLYHRIVLKIYKGVRLF